MQRLKLDSNQMTYSTPSGKKHLKHNKQPKHSEGDYDYINVISEENSYGTYDSSANAEDKDRYMVSNDNHVNAQMNFANCGVYTMVHLCLVILYLLSYVLL